LDTDFYWGTYDYYSYESLKLNKPLSVNISLFNYILFAHFFLLLISKLILKTRIKKLQSTKI